MLLLRGFARLPKSAYGTEGYWFESSRVYDLRRNQSSLAHALPTFPIEDLDLALIAGVWDRLADECMRVMIEVVRANLPTGPSGKG